MRTLPVIRCVLSLVVSVLAIAATTAQGAQEKGRELRGGWYRWDPYQFEENRGPLRELRGLDIQMVTRILAETGSTVSYEQIDWIEHQQQIKNGERDIAAGAYKTAEREEYAWFSHPYRTETDVLVTRRADQDRLPASNVKELLAALSASGMRVGLVSGFFYGPDVKAFALDPANADRIFYADTDNTNLSRLLKGEIDAFIADRLVVAAVAWRAGVQRQISQHKIPVFAADIHVMFGKKSTTPRDVEAFNLGLQQLKASGEYDMILRHYAMPVLLAITVQRTWFHLFDIVGTVAFAISGVLLARREHYDIFGAFVLASLPAVGGGVLRDLISGRSPLAVVASPIYLYVILATVLAGALAYKVTDYLGKRGVASDSVQGVQLSSNIYLFFDAVGLSAFTVIGVVVAVEQQCEPLWLWGPLLAALTGAGGGIIRDVVRADSNNSNLKGSFYPEVAVLWGFLFSLFLIWEAGRLNLTEVWLGVVATILGALATRLLVMRFGLRSPLMAATAPPDPRDQSPR